MTSTPDLLITNAVLWSRGELLEATAVLLRDGVVSALGEAEELRAQLSPAGTELDAEGGLVHPSFADSHVHPVMGGVERGRLDLTGCENAEETAAAIRAYAAERSDPWVLGGGWSMAHFPGGTPSRAALDELVPDRPAFLINADHHGAWANSRAFELAGITAETPDPSDGRFERDEQGVPSGTVHEGAASLFAGVLPETTLAECSAGLLAAQEYLLSCGVTAWQDAILGEFSGYPDVSPAYRQLLANDELITDVTGALWVPRDLGEQGAEAILQDFERRRAENAAAGFRTDTAKIMVDGVAENETAAMNEPYVKPCDCGGGNGLAYFTREQLVELVPLLNERGITVHFHAIGDRAARYALDAVTAVPADTRARVRNHIAHLQVVDPVDVPRFAELNVTANCQALWAAQEQQMTELTLPLLGETRGSWQYPFASIQRAGAVLAFGSDWPVSTPDAWQALHVAVNRQAPGDTETPPLIPGEALTLHAALTGYTHGSHELLGTPGGTLAVGAPANLAIANRNPFAGAPADIWRTENRFTLLRGRVVFAR